MTADELEERLRSGKSPVIIDVRSQIEFKSGHIRGAIHAPLMNVLRATQSACDSQEEPLILVCEHGPRAQLAKLRLKMSGYKNIQLLEGHMSQWRTSGRSVTKGL